MKKNSKKILIKQSSLNRVQRKKWHGKWTFVAITLSLIHEWAFYTHEQYHLQPLAGRPTTRNGLKRGSLLQHM
jgi:hypothetical protein